MKGCVTTQIFVYFCSFSSVSMLFYLLPYLLFYYVYLECDLPNKTCYQACTNMSNMKDATHGAGSALPSIAPEIHPSL